MEEAIEYEYEYRDAEYEYEETRNPDAWRSNTESALNLHC
jgi:hypothetical protein